MSSSRHRWLCSHSNDHHEQRQIRSSLPHCFWIILFRSSCTCLDQVRFPISPNRTQALTRPSSFFDFTLSSNNSSGHYKRATAQGLQLSVANAGGFVAAFSYPASEAPKYIQVSCPLRPLLLGKILQLTRSSSESYIHHGHVMRCMGTRSHERSLLRFQKQAKARG